MEKPFLRVLVVDDSADDAQQLADAMRKAGYLLKLQRVQDAVGMQSELAKGQWDLVICEHKLPTFSAYIALDILRHAGVDIPFIVITRDADDEDIVKVMRAGAHDVIAKDNAVRLIPVIERELRAIQERSSYHRISEALKEIEDNHRSLIESSDEAICYSQDGMHVDANASYLRLFGFESSLELEGIPFLNLVDKKDHARVKEYFRSAAQRPQAVKALACTAVHSEGRSFHVEIRLSPISLAGEACQQIIVSDISARKAAEEKLTYLGQHDTLTGLFNRQYFVSALNSAIAAAVKDKKASAMLYLDIEQLHTINDECGLEAGDRLLLALAQRLKEWSRPGDIVARLSGDEFAVLMPATDRDPAQKLAARITREFKGTKVIGGGKTRACGCTLSVLTVDASLHDAQQVLAQVHRMQAGTKNKGVPQPAKSAAAIVTTSTDTWQPRLEMALAKNRFHLVYQPIVNLHAEASENYEVLTRLVENDGEPIPARQFMAAAEQTGHSLRIDRWMLQHVIDNLMSLQQQGKSVRFFVNLSARTLCDPSFIPFFKEQLGRANMNGRFLVFEIDEASILRHLVEATAFVAAVRRLGSEIGVDQFALATVPFVRHQSVAYLKISGALIRDVANDNLNQTLVQTISQVAKALNKKTIAQYVENAECLTTLWNYGIDYVQGHYFQAPEKSLSYDFNVESISSDPTAPAWIPAR